MVHWHWCLYVWDFQRRKIVVLDPLSMGEEPHVLEKKHSHTVSLMHKAMTYCKNNFFPSQDEQMEAWESDYLDVKGANGTRLVIVVH